ncbi:hypothetical protein [Acinetobacter puyangensis]|uniref:hypothetical protein n=1 Tax=Acinetobacter puyangensis TaxID=1096779 RepID=UPI003A4D82B9
MMGYLSVSLRLSALTVALFTATSVTFALEKLDDATLADATGEGLAFALNDFSFQFKGTDYSAGTGYVRLIPVGAQSKSVNTYNATASNKIGKADVYLYGLSISANDGNANTQFSGDTINSGSYANPWMIKATTENYANFAGTSKPLSYFLIEAPTFNYETDPYNLKIGLWADGLVRDSSLEEGNAAQFQLNGATRSGTTYDNNGNPVTVSNQIRENRLRLQLIANGFSLNGSSLKLFQTLDGATNTGGLSSTYNNTLGMAGTIRLNSGDASTLRAQITDAVTASTGSFGTWTTVNDGAGTSFGTGATGCGNNAGGTTPSSTSLSTATSCQYYIQTRSKTDSKTVTRTWTAPSNTDDHVLRISTRETSSTDLLNTPALTGGAAPTFSDNEGLYLYQPNINLILGSAWQPLTFGVADDNRNFVMELARIPNVAAVYNEIYTDYFNNRPELKGGTCSIYWCGDDSKNATHSSITIGSTEAYSTAGTGRLSAYKGEDAIGVSFGALVSNTTTASDSKTVTEARYMQRTPVTSNWVSYYRDPWIGSSTSVNSTLTQWAYYDVNGNLTYTNDYRTYTNATCTQSGISTCTAYSPTGNTSTSALSWYGTQANRTWNTTSGAYLTTSSNIVDTMLNTAGINATTGITYNQSTNYANPSISSSGALNNLGSAVVDGLLIQHMKLTTKGL